jgi:GH15 family glucan-1,4-alpha-glucosidase
MTTGGSNAAVRASDARAAYATEIGDYAAIGDCRSAALVSRDGSLEWLCLPDFSSPSLFGALLHRPLVRDAAADAEFHESGGHFRIGPLTQAVTSRRYLPDSNVLETTFRTGDGVIRLVDQLTIPAGRQLQPMREVLRLVEGVEGQVPVGVEIDPRPDYGRKVPALHARGPKRWVWTWGNECAHLHTDFALNAQAGRLAGERVVGAGDRLWCSLGYTKSDIAVLVPLGAAARQRLDDTVGWWRMWVARARYAGPYRDAVARSALALKLLTYALSGAVVAAPSTSLPEAIHADRNWDYRYCWLRDAALTMRALVGLGLLDEARAFFDWMLHATRRTWPELQVLYDVYGRTRLDESQLDHWEGFCDSRPVRIGNAAHTQLQLDVYGAVCFAAREFVNATGTLAADEARLLRGFGATVCRQWRSPDHGIWEIRGEPRHYTFSKVMCWTALDALLDLSARGRLSLPAEVQGARDALRGLIEQRGFHAGLGAYAAVLDDDRVDASLLLAGCLGYADPGSERMRGTFARVHERLARNGLLLRYESGFDGIAAPEGAFGICSFWAIDNLARRGDRHEAHRAFQHVLGFANDVGLFAEEIEPASGALLGNFPQAYTHVGLINAALALGEE